MKCSYWFLMLAAITFVIENANEITGSIENYAAQLEPEQQKSQRARGNARDITIH